MALKIKRWLFILILFSNLVSALSVELSFPVNNAVFVDSNTISFRCKATGNDLRFLELYTNVGSWSKKSQVSNPQNNTDAIFSISNISNGDYIWNCKVIDGTEGIKFSDSNRSFSVNLAPNMPPVYNNALISQSWNMNTQKNNAFDLDNFFSDPEGSSLTYGVSGNANIIVNIDNNNLVSFSQPSNWFGTEKVYFTASDSQLSVNSNYINLTVVKTETQNSPLSNTAPRIENKIPDQNKTTEGSWLLDLNGYAKDNEDQESKLNWSVEDIDTSIIKYDIDNVNKRIKFTPQGKKGSNTIKLKISDTQGLSSSQNIIINIYEDKKQANEFEEDIRKEPKNTGFVINSFYPDKKEVILNPQESLDFGIETSQKVDYEWYLDNKTTYITKSYFTFNSISEGKHNLTVVATDLENRLTKSWNIIIKKEENKIENTQNIITPVCGNNIIETNETCSNCAEDIKCLTNQICEDNKCIERKSFLSITGSTIINTGNVLKKISLKSFFYIPLVILIFLLILILIIRKRNKTKYSYLKELEEKETFTEKFQKKLREIYKNRKQRKENKLNLINLEKKKQQEVINIAPSAISISGFIEESINKGHSKKTIKKVLKEKGWSRLQIWKAFRKI